MALTIKQRAHEVIEAVSDDATSQERLSALELRRGRARRRRRGSHDLSRRAGSAGRAGRVLALLEVVVAALGSDAGHDTEWRVAPGCFVGVNHAGAA